MWQFLRIPCTRVMPSHGHFIPPLTSRHKITRAVPCNVHKNKVLPHSTYTTSQPMPIRQKKWRSCSKQEGLQTLSGYTKQQPELVETRTCIESELKDTVKPLPHYLIWGDPQRHQVPVGLSFHPHPDFLLDSDWRVGTPHRRAAWNKFRVFRNSNPKFNTRSNINIPSSPTRFSGGHFLLTFAQQSLLTTKSSY